MIRIKAHIAWETCMSRGNCFSLQQPGWKGRESDLAYTDHWRVVNMDSDTFRNLALKEVDVEPLDEGHCVIVDDAIPRDKFFRKPCSICCENADDVLRRFPQYFRPDPRESTRTPRRNP